LTEKNTNGQKSTKQNLIDRNTLLLSVTEYIIYALQCQFCELFADFLCVYVCLFVRISVDTTVIIKKYVIAYTNDYKSVNFQVFQKNENHISHQSVC